MISADCFANDKQSSKLSAKAPIELTRIADPLPQLLYGPSMNEYIQLLNIRPYPARGYRLHQYLRCMSNGILRTNASAIATEHTVSSVNLLYSDNNLKSYLFVDCQS